MNKYAVIATFVAIFLILRSKKRGGQKKFNPEAVFLYMKTKYNKPFAQILEQMYRLETAHFQANIYKNTMGAGGLAFKNTKPYGHATKLFTGVNAIGIYKSANGLSYISFATLEDGVQFLANYLLKNGTDNVINRVKRWGGGNDTSAQDAYLSKVANMKSLFIN